MKKQTSENNQSIDPNEKLDLILMKVQELQKEVSHLKKQAKPLIS